jgi:hypothetical protein
MKTMFMPFFVTSLVGVFLIVLPIGKSIEFYSHLAIYQFALELWVFKSRRPAWVLGSYW